MRFSMTCLSDTKKYLYSSILMAVGCSLNGGMISKRKQLLLWETEKWIRCVASHLSVLLYYLAQLQAVYCLVQKAPWHGVESTSVYLLFLGLAWAWSSMFDVETHGFTLNNLSLQLMEYEMLTPCLSDLPDSRQPGNMCLLSGAVELKLLLTVI